MRIRLYRLLVLACLVAGALGCQTPSPPPEPAPQPREPVAPEQLYPLLDAAEAALAEDRLTAAPGQQSAHGYFLEVLALDPENDEALRGVERIVERFVELALAAADDWQLATARSMLARARLIDADHPSIAPTQAQIDLLSNANREEQIFDYRNMQSADNRHLLARMGKTAKTFDCHARIRAHNDVQGRWMYQQMNAAAGDDRVRATMEIGLPARVALVCFNP